MNRELGACEIVVDLAFFFLSPSVRTVEAGKPGMRNSPELGTSLVLCVLTLGIGYAIFGPQVRYQLWQFKLRSLLIIMTLASILFALIRALGFERFSWGIFLLAVLVAVVAFLVDLVRFLTK